MSDRARDENDRVECRCSCGARVRVPAALLGRKARCRKCRQAFVLRPTRAGAERAPAQREQERPDSARLTIRCACGARLTAPAKAAGRKTKCPKCGDTLTVPAPTGIGVEGPTVDSLDGSLLDALGRGEAIDAPPPGGIDSPPSHTRDTYGFAPEPEPDPEPLPSEVSARRVAAAAGEPKSCPSCHQSLPASAVICVNCGVDLKTGRALMTTQEDNLDQIYTYAESLIRWLSWIFWMGLYPIASEAFGLRKPRVTRAIALVTTLVSIWFMAAYIYRPSPDPELANLMLWSGDKSLRDLLQERGFEEKTIDAALARVAVRLEQGEYQPRQLITHAFLHAGPLHLAGNLLFLMVFGARVNALIGNILTALLYPLLAVIAGAAHLASSTGGLLHPMLGASGAIMGLAGMYIIFFPTHKVHMACWWRWGLIGGFQLSLKLFALRGFWVVLFYIAFDVVFTLLAWEDNVAHWAHLGGFLAGAGLALILLLSQLVNARGGDIVSKALGKHAWMLLGKPDRPGITLW